MRRVRPAELTGTASDAQFGSRWLGWPGPWRAFYRQMGNVIFVVGAIGPEAGVKPRDFVRAVRSAEDRLNKIEQDEEGH